jgi:formylglycine-generating enzyme required for sulfatase activity
MEERVEGKAVEPGALVSEATDPRPIPRRDERPPSTPFMDLLLKYWPLLLAAGGLLALLFERLASIDARLTELKTRMDAHRDFHNGAVPGGATTSPSARPDAPPIATGSVRNGAPRNFVTENGRVELIIVPPGSYQMGSPHGEKGREATEGPRHAVTISSFYLSRYEITNEQYARFLAVTPSIPSGETWAKAPANEPATNVSWSNAEQFAAWTGGRLPTEAEWEYAARAGTKTKTYAAGNLNAIAWYSANSADHVHDVGTLQPNAFGLYDMLGNVWEWCSDYWAKSYTGQEQVDPTGPGTGVERVIRGGSFRDGEDNVRAAARGWNRPGETGGTVGFRIASDL